jgi:hypothetical protein
MAQFAATNAPHTYWCTDLEQSAQWLGSKGWRRARWKRGVEHSRLARNGGVVISITSTGSVVAIDSNGQAVLELVKGGLL